MAGSDTDDQGGEGMTTDENGAPAPLTPVTFHILVTLAGEAVHGYEIKRRVEERTRGAVRLGAGTLYAGIRRMVDDGLIEETAPPPGLDEEPHSRTRFYGITMAGRSALGAEVRRLEADLQAARAVVERPA